VKEAKDGDKITPGTVYIAPGMGHMSIEKVGIEKRIKISQNKEYIYRPSVDLLMTSAAEHYPGSCLGVILTGMGNDGLKGMTAIKKSGGRTISQDEDTCVIYGMPKAVVDAGMADKIVPLGDIAGEILNSV
jgi:two-component system chemotaxis response regulator CheB